MPSKWKVTSNIIDGKKMYGVYRLKDESKPDHSGNREVYGIYHKERETAEVMANMLNMLDKEDKP